MRGSGLREDNEVAWLLEMSWTALRRMIGSGQSAAPKGGHERQRPPHLPTVDVPVLTMEPNLSHSKAKYQGPCSDEGQGSDQGLEQEGTGPRDLG